MVKQQKLPLLVAAIMVKNEQPRIIRTMSTVVDYVDAFVLLDTGSSDETILTAKGYAQTQEKPIYIYEEPFVDFSVSRNALLKHCYGKSEFVLLLDANDEVIRPDIMVDFLKNKVKSKKDSVFSVKFELMNDMRPGARASYSRIAIVRNDCPDILYDMPVHERITCTNPQKYNHVLHMTELSTYIYQDRAMDKPSTERYKRDVELLEKYAHQKGGYEPRVLHYLCQSCVNMDDFVNLKKYASLLIKFDQPNEYLEYVFYAYMHLGTAGFKLTPENTEWKKWFLKAYQYSKKKVERCEPIFILAVYCYNINEVEMSKLYIKRACSIARPTPEQAHSTQINYNIYDVERVQFRKFLSNKLGEEI